MMNRYLNRHFVGMSEDESAIFDISKQRSIVSFEHKVYDDIDESPHRYKIDVDHIAFSQNVLYIFDSKYYIELDKLNYKQLAYNELLRDYNSGTINMYNILFLPGHNGRDVHFCFSSKCVGQRKIGIKIIEQYIEPKYVMRDYLLS